MRRVLTAKREALVDPATVLTALEQDQVRIVTNTALGEIKSHRISTNLLEITTCGFQVPWRAATDRFRFWARVKLSKGTLDELFFRKLRSGTLFRRSVRLSSPEHSQAPSAFPLGNPTAAETLCPIARYMLLAKLSCTR